MVLIENGLYLYGVAGENKFLGGGLGKGCLKMLGSGEERIG